MTAVSRSETGWSLSGLFVLCDGTRWQRTCVQVGRRWVWTWVAA